MFSWEMDVVIREFTFYSNRSWADFNETLVIKSVTVSAIATLHKPVQDLQERDYHIMQKT